MNHGTRNAKMYQYDENAALSAVNADSRVAWDMIERQIDEAQEWYQTRGTPGDGVDTDSMRELADAVGAKDRETAVKASLKVLSGRMHPTARDIVGTPAKQAIYNITGKRAYNYETNSGNAEN